MTDEQKNMDDLTAEEAAGNQQPNAADENTDTQATQQEAAAQPTTDELLAQAQAEIESLKTQALYKQAEFDNYRKRTLKEKTELILNGAEKTVTQLLPVMDDFERALQNIEKADNLDAVREGVELIYQKFVKTLGTMGVEQIDTDNADFDVDVHEAIAQIPAPTDELKGKVVDCVQKGYKLNDKVIRHAKVAVGV